MTASYKDIQHSGLSYRYYTRKFGSRLFTSILPLILLCVFAISVSQYYNEKNITDANQDVCNHVVASVMDMFSDATTIATSLESPSPLQMSLEKIVRQIGVSSGDYRVISVIQNFLNSIVATHQYVYSIYVDLPNKLDLFMTNEGIRLASNFYDLSWRSELINKDDQCIYWSSARSIQRFPSINHITHVVSVFYRMGGSGTVVVNYKSSYLHQLLDSMRRNSKQSIFLLNESDELIAYAGKQADLKKAKAGGTKDLFVNTADIADIGWRVLSTWPPSASSSSLASTAIMRVSWILCGTMILVFVLLVAVQTRQTTRDLKTIIDMIDTTSQGRTPVVADKRIGDEYGYIIQSIVHSFLEKQYLTVQLSERQYKQQALELMLAQMQINPHFLYNTLETINWRAIELTQSDNAVSQMISRLSKLLRYATESVGGSVTLAEEIENTGNYIDIMRVRHHNRFRVDWHIPPQMQNVQVIRLILQPLIENSLQHGMRLDPATHIITITAVRSGDRLDLHVRDNGIGMTAERLRTVQESLHSESMIEPSSVGLCNINKRLELTFGDEYGLRIESTQGIGTVITALMPWTTHDEH